MPPLTQANTNDDVKKSFDEIVVYVNTENKNLFKRKVTAWAITGVIHASILLFALFFAYIAVKEKDVDYLPMRITQVADVPVIKPILPPDPTVVITNTKPLDTDNVIETPVLPSDAEDSDTQSEDIVSDTDSKAGKTEAVSDSEMGGVGVFAMIGSGGPSSGMYGNRGKSGHKQARQKYYGPIGGPVDATINAGLDWLKKHQNIDGSWSAETYYKNCIDQLKCEPGKNQAGDTDVAMTGYALMCFLGAGYDHKVPSKYSKVCSKAVSWLINNQAKDGHFGKRNYENAIATQAIAEAYAMTSDINLRKPLENGIKVISDQQAKNDKYELFGWDYERQNIARNDGSVTGWNIMALKSALGAGINTTAQLKGGEHYLELAWKAANPKWKDLDQYKTSIFPYCWNATTNVSEKDYFSAVGAACLVFMGRNKGDVQFETLLADAEQRWLSNTQYKSNLYHLYYLGMAEFEAGDTNWVSFRDKTIPWLISTQRLDGTCLNGSFNSSGQNWPGADTGRVLSTCYSLLTLEVAYRYAKIKR
jgi:hypothetical protein